MKARKILTMVAALALTAALAIGGTLAYLTAKTDSITNTFTVGNIKIGLTETLPEGKSAKMVPGDSIEKNPTAKVLAGSEASWLFVKIEEKGNVIYTPAGATQTATAGFDDFLTYAIADGWTQYSINPTDATKNNTIIIYRAVTATDATSDVSYQILAGGTDSMTSGKVDVKNTVTQEMMDGLATISDGEVAPQLIFTAAAVQSANLTTVADAWAQLPAAFKPAA